LPEKRTFQRSLLRWYSQNKRELPWRKTRDPYKIMVSEFMLQQTRIETVLPYYDRFLNVFPTLPDLALAPIQKILKLWAGMGYYARARNLHAAARKILKELGGKIPSKKSELLSLPGFGPYTAGAVASIAFNEATAALDGNVKRVLSRLVGMHGPISPVQQKRLERIGEDLIPPGQASDFNQALMDLGALFCLPLRPKCSSCPVGNSCSFPKIGLQPRNRQERKQRKEDWLVGLIEKEGRLLLHQKEGKGLLAGLWQFPTIVFSENAPSSQKRKAIKDEEILRKSMQEDFGIRIKFRKALPPLQHSFTHIQATMKPYLFSLLQDVPTQKLPPHARWIRFSSLSRYPISRAMAKVSNLLSTLDSQGIMEEQKIIGK
jgi:A/G-specific adenine glycosylase